MEHGVQGAHHVWSYASRAARHGEWEQIARDRERFRRRIQRLSEIIELMLVHKYNTYLRNSINLLNALVLQSIAT